MALSIQLVIRHFQIHKNPQLPSYYKKTTYINLMHLRQINLCGLLYFHYSSCYRKDSRSRPITKSACCLTFQRLVRMSLFLRNYRLYLWKRRLCSCLILELFKVHISCLGGIRYFFRTPHGKEIPYHRNCFLPSLLSHILRCNLYKNGCIGRPFHFHRYGRLR